MSDKKLDRWRVLSEGVIVTVEADTHELRHGVLSFYKGEIAVAKFATLSWFASAECEYQVVGKKPVDKS